MIPKKFENYTKKYEKYRITVGDTNSSRLLRLFDIRFRLAMDIKISFNTTVSYTKSKDVRDTYSLLFQLTEFWNAFDALLQWLKNEKFLEKTKWFEIFNCEIYDTVTKKTLDVGLKELKKFYKDEKFAIDFDEYLNRIQNSELSPELKANAGKVSRWLKQDEKVSEDALLRLIVSDRNLAYHHAEGSKMGSSYSNRKKVLSFYIKVLGEFINAAAFSSIKIYLMKK